MILRIFITALLFFIITVPITCAAAAWVIDHWYSERLKHIGKVLQITGEEMKKYSIFKKKEGNNDG